MQVNYIPILYNKSEGLTLRITKSLYSFRKKNLLEVVKESIQL